MNLLRSSKVQVPPLPFMAAEKLKPPLPSPFFSLTVPKRFGPTRLGPPFSKVWQAAHFLAAAAPFSTEAVCNSFSIGSGGGPGFFGPPGGSAFFSPRSFPRLFPLFGGKNPPAGEIAPPRKREGGPKAPR